MSTGDQSGIHLESTPGGSKSDASLARRVSDDNPSPEQIEAYRRMSPGRRLEIAEQLYWSARRMKSAWLRSLHPDWSDEAIEAEVTRNFQHARS